MTASTSYKITDIKSKKSFNVNPKNFEDFKLMTIGLEDRYSVEEIQN